MQINPAWGSSVEVDMAPLGLLMKENCPPCCVCGYDAGFIVKVGSLERLFCATHLLDVLLDSLHFVSEERIPA